MKLNYRGRREESSEIWISSLVGVVSGRLVTTEGSSSEVSLELSDTKVLTMGAEGSMNVSVLGDSSAVVGLPL